MFRKPSSLNKCIALVLFTVLAGGQALADGIDVIAKKTDNPLVPPDGLKTGTEYLSAQSLGFALGDARGLIKAHRNTDGSVEELHILLSVEDNGSVDATDNVVIFFDTFHNHNNTNNENRGILINRNHAACGAVLITSDNPCTDANLIKIVSDDPNTPVDTGASVAALPSFQILRQVSTTTYNTDNTFLYDGGWTAEVIISASHLNLNFLPEVMGFFVKASTGSATNTPQHPPAGNAADLLTWANLKTRYPLDLVLLLDQSGSMRRRFDGSDPTSLERWNAAKKSADLMAVSLCPFQESYYDDQLGLVTYYWNAGSNQHEIISLKSLSGLCPFTSSYVNSETGLSVPVSTNLTPIGAGLEKSFEQFLPLAAERDRTVVLLSDGFHNRPSTTFNCSANTALACPELPTDPVGQIQVNTVSLGPDTSVGTDLLSDLKDRFGGFGKLYSSTVTPEQLQKSFVENLYAYYYLNEIPRDATQQFFLEHNERRLFVMLFWGSTLAADRGFHLRKPDGTFITTTDPGYHHYKSTGEYEVAYYALEDIIGGTTAWQIVKTDNTAFLPAEIDNAFVLVDPRLYASFHVEQSNSNIILQALLKEDGKAVSGPDVEVYVDIDKPTEGFGTYLSTTNEQCETVKPLSLDPTFTKMIGRGLSTLASGRTSYLSVDPLRESILLSSTPATTSATTAGDPLPPAYQLLNTLFQKCGKNALNRDQQNRFILYDDGSHGDKNPGDGIYSRIFTNARYEGSYNFTFSAQGKTPTEKRFARTRRISEYVEILPEPSFSELVTSVISEDDAMVSMDIRFIPRDKNGEYLGPGKSRFVSFSTTGGKLTSPVHDHLNGVYSQTLLYNSNTEKPVVSAHVRGEKITAINVVKKYDLTVFIGYFTFDSNLNMDDNAVYGISLGYPLTSRATVELEASVTPTENSMGRKGDIEQLLLNIRYKIPSSYPYEFYAIAGLGNTAFKSFSNNTNATTAHLGAGLINQINSSLSIRAQARAFHFDSVYNSGTTLNYQATVGLMFQF